MGKSKPENKAQRQARRDSAYECNVGGCGATFATANELGLHKILAHPADNP